MRKTFVIALMMATTLPIFAQTEIGESERIVATINGEKLTVGKFNYLWDSLSPEMRKNYELTGGGKIGFLDNYIERRLVLQQAIKENFDKQKSIEYELENAKDSALFTLYVSQVVAADVIPEAELRAYYDEHKSEFQQPEMRKARHIIATPQPQPVWNTADDDANTSVRASQKIEALRKELTGDVAQFADLASKYSEDMSARSGGDLGWVKAGKLADALDRALFSLKKGQVSDVVITEYGYHVILCEDIRPAGVQPFEEVRTQIAKKLSSSKQAAIITALRALTQDLRRASNVTVNRENL